MNKRLGILALIVAVLAVGGLVWWKRGGESTTASGPAGVTARGSGAAAVRAPTAAARPASVVVRVNGPSGPLASATVRLEREGGDVTTLQTGADGSAKADGLEPGTWSASATASGHEPAAATSQELRGGETASIELTLAAGGRTLSGTVTDASGGPIAGARIDAAKLGSSARPSDAVASALTAADGTYSMSVAEGQLLVAASEASYAPQSRYVDVGPAGATANFQLVPGGVIEGVVRDEATREPVAGANIDARRDEPAMMLGERSRVRAVSAADGRFRLAGLRPGGYSVSAQAGPRMSRLPTTIGLGVAEQVSDVELLVAKAPSIRGTVVDERGAPVADAEVTVFGLRGRGRSLDARSDAKGAFVVEAVQPGRYMLMAHNDTYLPAGDTVAQVENADVEVTVKVREGLALKGHVEPRQACEVKRELASMNTHDLMTMGSRSTAADGAFDLGPARAAEYELEARCASGDQGTMRVTVTPGLGEVVLAVKPGASISGHVVDGKGQPVAAVTVMASPTGDTERTTIVNGRITSGIQALTNGQGAFELRGLAAGPYRLGVLDKGRPLPSKSGDPTVTLAAAEKKTGVTLTVDRPDGVIRGVVTGPDGKPLADAWVSVHVGIEDLIAARTPREGGGARSRVRVEVRNDEGGTADTIAPVLTDDAGRFEITALARVPMTVLAEAQAGALRGQAMAVTPDANITIQALGLSELRGTVKSPTGPPSWFTVELDGPTDEQRTFATADGTFTFARLDPGTYQVTVTSSAGNGTARVDILSGRPATVEVVLAPNAIVIGTLVDAAGKPLGGLPVAVIPDAGDGRMQISLEGPPPTSNPDGSFRLEAKAGRSGIIVLSERPTTKMGLLLEAGKTLDVGPITVDTSTPP